VVSVLPSEEELLLLLFEPNPSEEEFELLLAKKALFVRELELLLLPFEFSDGKTKPLLLELLLLVVVVVAVLLLKLGNEKPLEDEEWLLELLLREEDWRKRKRARGRQISGDEAIGENTNKRRV
jgi:hypothetical protein